jgi:hypothetical protein
VSSVLGGSSRPCPCPEHQRAYERRLLWNGDSAPNWLPREVGGGWGVSEAVEGFVTSLAGVLWLGLDTAASGGAMGAAADVLLIDTILPWCRSRPRHYMRLLRGA